MLQVACSCVWLNHVSFFMFIFFRYCNCFSKSYFKELKWKNRVSGVVEKELKSWVFTPLRAFPCWPMLIWFEQATILFGENSSQKCSTILVHDLNKKRKLVNFRNFWIWEKGGINWLAANTNAANVETVNIFSSLTVVSMYMDTKLTIHTVTKKSLLVLNSSLSCASLFFAHQFLLWYFCTREKCIYITIYIQQRRKQERLAALCDTLFHPWLD